MKKTLISLAAVATLAIGLSATAKADPGLGFGFGIGPNGQPHFGVSVYDPSYGYNPGYGQSYEDAGYDDGGDCYTQWVPSWHWNAWHTYKVKTMKKVWLCD
jgi:ABC-type sugar transport system substrate-binding protein